MKLAQIDPEMRIFYPELDEPVQLKANRKYVLVLDTEKYTLKIESYYWFIFKNWVKRIFKEARCQR